MRRKILYLLIVVVSVNCIGQSSNTLTINLQQIEFKDKTLTKTLFDLSKSNSDCLNRRDIYVLDFFQSSLSTEEFFLRIDLLTGDEHFIESIAYYVIINDVVYFLPDSVSTNIIKVLPQKRMFTYEIEHNPGGDYNFLIWSPLKGYYQVLASSCSE